MLSFRARNRTPRFNTPSAGSLRGSIVPCAGKSKRAGQSLNDAAITALTRGLGLADERPRYHDLDHLAGTWEEDSAFDAAVAAQDQVDPRLSK
jgi:hypothetical protein